MKKFDNTLNIHLLINDALSINSEANHILENNNSFNSLDITKGYNLIQKFINDFDVFINQKSFSALFTLVYSINEKHKSINNGDNSFLIKLLFNEFDSVIFGNETFLLKKQPTQNIFSLDSDTENNDFKKNIVLGLDSRFNHYSVSDITPYNVSLYDMGLYNTTSLFIYDKSQFTYVNHNLTLDIYNNICEKVKDKDVFIKKFVKFLIKDVIENYSSFEKFKPLLDIIIKNNTPEFIKALNEYINPIVNNINTIIHDYGLKESFLPELIIKNVDVLDKHNFDYTNLVLFLYNSDNLKVINRKNESNQDVLNFLSNKYDTFKFDVKNNNKFVANVFFEFGLDAVFKNKFYYDLSEEKNDLFYLTRVNFSSILKNSLTDNDSQKIGGFKNHYDIEANSLFKFEKEYKFLTDYIEMFSLNTNYLIDYCLYQEFIFSNIVSFLNEKNDKNTLECIKLIKNYQDYYKSGIYNNKNFSMDFDGEFLLKQMKEILNHKILMNKLDDIEYLDNIISNYNDVFFKKNKTKKIEKIKI